MTNRPLSLTSSHTLCALLFVFLPPFLIPTFTLFTHFIFSFPKTAMHQDSSSSHSIVQAIRSVPRTHPPTTSTTPTTPDHVFYIECHKDPVTNKDVVLWDDILQAFEDALHVQHQARVVPFDKGSDLRTYVREVHIFFKEGVQYWMKCTHNNANQSHL